MDEHDLFVVARSLQDLFGLDQAACELLLARRAMGLTGAHLAWDQVGTYLIKRSRSTGSGCTAPAARTARPGHEGRGAVLLSWPGCIDTFLMLAFTC